MHYIVSQRNGLRCMAFVTTAARRGAGVGPLLCCIFSALQRWRLTRFTRVVICIRRSIYVVCAGLPGRPTGGQFNCICAGVDDAQLHYCGVRARECHLVARSGVDARASIRELRRTYCSCLRSSWQRRRRVIWAVACVAWKSGARRSASNKTGQACRGAVEEGILRVTTSYGYSRYRDVMPPSTDPPPSMPLHSLPYVITSFTCGDRQCDH